MHIGHHHHILNVYKIITPSVTVDHSELFVYRYIHRTEKRYSLFRGGILI